ncbi:MAG: S8 family serine peptidase [Bacteroidales bacterium]|nr:S8 family serine peptidase [Bacteroidales bacterium]
MRYFRLLWVAAVLICSSVQLSAQSVDAYRKMSMLLRQQAQENAETKVRDIREGRPTEQLMVGGLVKLAEGEDESVLKDFGCYVIDHVGNIYITLMPADELIPMASSSAIVRMEARPSSHAMTDTTRFVVRSDLADPENYTQNNLPQAFTGRGVVVGVSDQGFDYTHPMFREADGSSRIRRAWDIYTGSGNGYHGIGSVYENSADVLAAEGGRFTNGTHGTHVAGIAAGSPWKNYCGMAWESDIVLTQANLSGADKELIEYLQQDVNRALEVDGYFKEMTERKVNTNNILEILSIKYPMDYATECGEPCVVNCSWGMQAWLLSDYTLEEELFKSLLGPGRIIVFSAGNDGDSDLYDSKKASDPVYDHDLYVSDTLVYMQVRTYDDAKFTFMADGQNYGIEVTAAQVLDHIIQYNEYLGYQIDYPDGRFIVSSYCEQYTDGSYGLTFTISIPQTILDVSSLIRLVIESDADAEIMGQYYKLVFSKEKNCNNPLTVGYPGCLPCMLTVGLTSHRDFVEADDGKIVTFGLNYNPLDQVVSWSGCGPTVQGLIKPDVVAPGYNIVSAMNSLVPLDSKEYKLCEKSFICTYPYGDKDYKMVCLSGTSMAAPVVTGVVALWLQADPTLTTERIKEVIARTSRHLDSRFEYPNYVYGNGEIDAYAGLLDILGLANAIPDLSTNQPERLHITLSDHTLRFDTAVAAAVRLYATDGRLLLSTRTTDGIVPLPEGLADGVYAVQVNTDDSRTTGSTLIRIGR